MTEQSFERIRESLLVQQQNSNSSQITEPFDTLVQSSEPLKTSELIVTSEAPKQEAIQTGQVLHRYETTDNLNTSPTVSSSYFYTPKTSLKSETILVLNGYKSNEVANKEETKSTGSISDSISSFSTLEIPIEVEDRSNNTVKTTKKEVTVSLNNSSITQVSDGTSAADETLTFYEDKYIPEYIDTKKLLSNPLEVFADTDNLIYARVKL